MALRSGDGWKKQEKGRGPITYVAVAVVNREGEVVRVDIPTTLIQEACALSDRVGECASTRCPCTRGSDVLSFLASLSF